ncbi:hypothetical protein PC9H_007796 [Pleurotus ostreatus]|uniref:Ribosomal RNA-processing protein 17 n=2 Tax=Pleurotus ostreatus TaxID=5322 RepID=A0A067NJ35_PLEO1|nr:uncharacterized protein PC9H_007796 [Pleurotus ostreatus]KAF7428570.1 hypothetical protein PC9H_007796 [Pleurotus ostreatus]KDQ28048.1 hypothetical protein PLEOSDRAFT_1083937 [Pleurotus ostreatus PC15]
MAPSTNIATLTKSHHAIAAKKRHRAQQPKEVTFDEEARREFLTGFHKRKLAKQTAARQKAIEREKQQHLEARREQRKALREQAAANAAQVEKAYGGMQDDDDDDWDGISRVKEDEEAEYEGEEVVATVTIVDDFDPTEIIHGPSKPQPSSPNAPSSRGHTSSTAERTSRVQPVPHLGHKHRTPSTAQSTTSKARPKSIKYETNAARKAQKMKQRARRTEKAERAGGKAARKRPTNRTKRR